MSEYTITSMNNLNDKQMLEATSVFLEAFSSKMTMLSKNKSVLAKLFLPAFDKNLFYVCLDNDKVVGIIGLGTNKRRCTNFELKKVQAIFGKIWGRILFNSFKLVFSSRLKIEDNDIYIDYLATEPSYRGKGVGTTLLDYLFENMVDCTTFYITVVSTNPGAQRLYERVGFKVTGIHFNWSLFIAGAGRVVKLKKEMPKRTLSK